MQESKCHLTPDSKLKCNKGWIVVNPEILGPFKWDLIQGHWTADSHKGRCVQYYKITLMNQRRPEIWIYMCKLSIFKSWQTNQNVKIILPKKKKSYCQGCKSNQTNLQARCDLQGCHFANCAWHHWLSNFRVQNHLGSLSVQIPRAHTWESKRILIQLVHWSSRIYSFFLISKLFWWPSGKWS